MLVNCNHYLFKKHSNTAYLPKQYKSIKKIFGFNMKCSTGIKFKLKHTLQNTLSSTYKILKKMNFETIKC